MTNGYKIKSSFPYAEIIFYTNLSGIKTVDVGFKDNVLSMNKTTRLMKTIKKTIDEKEYADFIRVNIQPANSFIPADEIMTLLDQPFAHFKKTKRKKPPQNVLKLPGAGFLTKMCRRERSTTDYLLVWYEKKQNGVLLYG